MGASLAEVKTGGLFRPTATGRCAGLPVDRVVTRAGRSSSRVRESQSRLTKSALALVIKVGRNYRQTPKGAVPAKVMEQAEPE